MLFFGWQDRSATKQKLSKWVNSDDPHFVLSVSDPYELSDIDSWLQNETVDWLTAQASFVSDSEIYKYNLLDSLIFDLGEANFATYKNTLKHIPDSAPIIISQSMGDKSKAKEEIQFRNNTQTIDVQLDRECISRQAFYERNILQIFKPFIADLSKLAGKKRILLIIKFKGQGLDEVNSNFRDWFEEHFLNSLGQIPNVKICVISQGTIDTLSKIREDQKVHLTTLSLQEIIDISKDVSGLNRDFCCGVVDLNDTVGYKEFKQKVHHHLQRSSQ